MNNSAIISKSKIQKLKQFYELMDKTALVRRNVVNSLYNSRQVQPEDQISLENALASLGTIPEIDGKHILSISDEKTIAIDMSYELNELKKDLFFIKNGEEKFYGYLEGLHSDFSEYVQSGTDKLQGLKFNNFITDRDGTINNYCGRYRSSTQSAYNGLFLSRFAKKCTTNSIIITSAPLVGPGILDISVNMPKTFIYAASKAREFLDSNDIRHEYEIDNVREEKIKELNLKLEELVKDPAYEIYSLIGSGLQFKFGQTTIARQDINGTVPEEESDNFLKLITTIVGDIDPEKQYFVIEDTGLDIEIILTIKSNEGEAPLKDFDKGDGIDYLSAKLNLHLDNGPHLVCGDTSSDLRMIDTLVEKTDDTWAIFVTKDNDLADETAKLCNNHFIVPEPDMLVTILNELSKGKL